MVVSATPTFLALVFEAIAALAQGALAVSLGTLARILGGAPKLAADAAGMTWMSRVWSLLPPSLAATPGSAVALAGLLAITIRGGAYILLEAHETRDAALLASRARLRMLASALAGRSSRGSPDSNSRSIGAAVTWPIEIEAGARAERARLRAIVHLAVLGAVIVALDLRLALIVVGCLAPFALILRPIRRALRSAHARASLGAIETIDASRDLLEHAPLWATCGGGAIASRRVELLSREGAMLAARAARRRLSASTANEVLAALAVVILVSVFAPGDAQPRATLVPVLITLVSAYRPIRELTEASAVVERGVRAWEAIAALGAARGASMTPRDWPRGTLRIRDLKVDVGCERARDGIDLELRPGEIAAIVGAPGTGKSALLEAIAGVRPMGGVLEHAGARFDTAEIGPAHRPIAWVPPSPPVLPGTVAENLAPDAPTDPQRVARARELLRALGDETIVSLADDAQLGPRGLLPSSGESQRIALARAMSSGAPVLLLDEPTANLDEEGEQRAMATLRTECSERCVILVTHRPAPLSLADRVIDLDPRASRERIVGAAESERRIA
jgi:ABC-type transport system involved in cytochrome bd biosynthesis fused ATPase/permease subunit